MTCGSSSQNSPAGEIEKKKERKKKKASLV